jgi:GNAT superfamily N-acetyltransferase
MVQENGEQPVAASVIVRRMIDVRAATAADAEEVVRLRVGAIDATNPGPWRAQAVEDFRTGIGSGTFGAFVVAADEPGRLAAFVLGAVDQRVASPANPSGRTGYVFGVATEPAYRRRGYSRACMERLLAWYQEQNVTRVDLIATPEGEPLYASLGFVRRTDPAMRLRR